MWILSSILLVAPRRDSHSRSKTTTDSWNVDAKGDYLEERHDFLALWLEVTD